MADLSTWRENARKDIEEVIKDLEKRLKEERQKIGEQTKTDRTYYPPPHKYYWIVVILYVFAQIGFGYYISFPLTKMVLSIGIPMNVGVALLLLQSLHFIGSFRSIGVHELAGFTLFGRPWFDPKDGLYIVPLWILGVIRANRNYRDKRFPGPADKIFRISSEEQRKREGGDIPPEGKVRPIFVTTGEPRLTATDIQERKQDGYEINALDRQLSVEIAYFVRYRPDKKNGGIFRIARNLSSNTENIDERIEDLLREQSERDMKVILSRHTFVTATENRGLINKAFIIQLSLASMRLGIDIDPNGGGLEDMNSGHSTNEEQAKAAQAIFKKMAEVTAAEATKITILKKREGEADGELRWLTAIADGRRKIMEALKIKNGEAILASETARLVLEKTDVILAGGESGMKDMMSLVKGAQIALNSGSAEKIGETKIKEGV